ncbi:MAG: hypothetical protein WAX14_10480 [Rhodococcus sp. (in: high G+C Gram-positive bacteria)]|uniref:hypothetical protein n=1 Tax=Rhodococcus sp. TaxID=1831 RepID=UPI003BB5981E
MATSTQRSSSTVAAAAAARLHSVLNLAVLGLAAFGLGVAGLVARSFPASWSGVAVSVVFVVGPWPLVVDTGVVVTQGWPG